MESARSLYDQPRNTIWDRYRPHLSGARSGLLCIISHDALPQKAHDALIGAARALGYGITGTTFITVHPETSEEAGCRDILTMVESLDPLCVVIADTPATHCVAQAYHAKIALDAQGFLAGRPLCCFKDFPSLLNHETSKRFAWDLLKTLPPAHLGES